MRALIVDNQPLFADGVARIIRGSQGACEIIAAPSLDVAIRRLEIGSSPDISVISVERPVCRVPRAIADFIRDMRGTAVLALVSTLDMRVLREVMRAGAHGLIPRTASSDTFAKAIEKVLGGGRFIPEDLPLDAMASESGRTDFDGVSDRPGTVDFSHLTPRQREVLQLLAQGQSNQEIASELGIALATVKLHVNAILRGLRLRNRTEAAAMAIVAGITEPGLGAPSPSSNGVHPVGNVSSTPSLD